MKKKEFLVDVMAEINNIKAKATKTEIGYLNIYLFNHSSPIQCIYGQMTGDCTSQRAQELTPKIYAEVWGHGYNFRAQKYDHGSKFTPLEKYLYMVRRPMHAKIIAYLKGETNTLELI